MSAVAGLNLAVQPNPIDVTQNEFCVDGLVTLSGNYGVVSGHGDILDLSQMGVPSDVIPTKVEVYEAPSAGNAPTGYVFIYAPGTALNNGKLIVMQCAGSGNPFAEITQGSAYPAALTAATANLRFRAWLAKFI